MVPWWRSSIAASGPRLLAGGLVCLRLVWSPVVAAMTDLAARVSTPEANTHGQNAVSTMDKL